MTSHFVQDKNFCHKSVGNECWMIVNVGLICRIKLIYQRMIENGFSSLENERKWKRWYFQQLFCGSQGVEECCSLGVVEVKKFHMSRGIIAGDNDA